MLVRRDGRPHQRIDQIFPQVKNAVSRAVKRARAGSMPPPAVVAAGAVGVEGVRRSFAGRASAPVLSNFITQDAPAVVASKRRKMSKGERLRLKRRKKMKRKWRRKVRKAVNTKRFKMKLLQCIGRSYVAAAGQSVWVAIPILGYRGLDSTTASVAAAGAGSAEYSFRGDDIALIRNYLAGNSFFPSGAAANSALVNWWFKVQSVTIDVSMTYQGTTSSSDSSANWVEYDVYLAWSGKNMKSDPTIVMNNLTTIDNRAQEWEQKYGGAATLTLAAPGQPGWVPWFAPGMKQYISVKKIASGYMNNQATRFTKKIKPRALITNRNYTDDVSDTANKNMLYKKGLTQVIYVNFRGVPAPFTGAYSRTRMAFSVEKRYSVITDGSNQPVSFDSGYLVAADYA